MVTFIVETMIWPIEDTVTLIIGILCTNILLAIVHKLGPAGIIVTWIPGRVIVLAISILNSKRNDSMEQVLEVAWASHILTVVFLCAFHMFVRWMSWSKRLPRFGCAIKHWLAAFILMGVVCIILWAFPSTQMYIGMGTLALVMNLVNIEHAPKHLKNTKMKFTPLYLISANVVYIALTLGVHLLIEYGYIVYAGLVSNLPLFSIALFASSSCRDTPLAIQMTAQHVYMLAFQTWPSMAFLGILWVLLPQGSVIALSCAGMGAVATMAVQYFVVKARL